MKPEQSYEHQCLTSMHFEDAYKHLEKFSYPFKVTCDDKHGVFKHYEYLTSYWVVNMIDDMPCGVVWFDSALYQQIYGKLKSNGVPA